MRSIDKKLPKSVGIEEKNQKINKYVVSKKLFNLVKN